MKINIKKTRHKPTYKRPNGYSASRQCISPCHAASSKYFYRPFIAPFTHNSFYLYPSPNYVPSREC